jgi:hypothetical protein
MQTTTLNQSWTIYEPLHSLSSTRKYVEIDTFSRWVFGVLIHQASCKGRVGGAQ